MRFDDVDAAKAWITSQVRRQSVFYGFGTAEIVVEDGL
jgi:antibiotic biosynthesis monooxygenase (ABM) superfamily enzyme